MSGKNLSFLSKKSWHTGTIRHMDKVWRAEQKHDSEQKKIQELQRELERERSRKELLDAKNGTTSNKGKESLEWMYRGVLTAKTTEQELNKPYVAPDEKEDLETPSLLQRKPVSATQDDWNKVMEDPLLNIKQQEQDAIKMIATNPLKMQEIMKALKEREESKKRKKSKSHKKRKSRRDTPSPSPPRKRRRSRSPSPRSKHRGEKHRDSKSTREHDRHRDDERKDRYKYKADKYKEDRYERRDDRYSRRDSKHRREDKYDRREDNYDRREDTYDHKEDRYERSSDRTDQTDDVRRYDDRDRRDAHGGKRYRRGGARTAGMSEEEKQARLREMEEAGKSNYDMKVQRYIKSKRETEKDDEEITKRNEDENFLTDMKQGVYMGNETTIEERLGRNRHYLKTDRED